MTDGSELIRFLRLRFTDDRAFAEDLEAQRREAVENRAFDLAARLGKHRHRIAADVAAKARIVDSFVRCPACARGVACTVHEVPAGAPSWRFAYPYEEGIARLLAAPYDRHPEYRREWRP